MVRGHGTWCGPHGSLRVSRRLAACHGGGPFLSALTEREWAKGRPRAETRSGGCDGTFGGPNTLTLRRRAQRHRLDGTCRRPAPF